MDYDLRRGGVKKDTVTFPQGEDEYNECEIEYHAEYIEIHHFPDFEYKEHYKIGRMSEKAECKTDCVDEFFIGLFKQLSVICDKFAYYFRASARTHKNYHFPSGDVMRGSDLY